VARWAHKGTNGGTENREPRTGCGTGALCEARTEGHLGEARTDPLACGEAGQAELMGEGVMRSIGGEGRPARLASGVMIAPDELRSCKEAGCHDRSIHSAKERYIQLCFVGCRQ
jgi:hypothetical protein